MNSAPTALLICSNKSGFTLKNRKNGKEYCIKQGKNRRNEALAAFISDEIKSSPERTELFIKYLAQKVDYRQKYGFTGLIVSNKPFFDRTADCVTKIVSLIRAKKWRIDGSQMNEYFLFEIARKSGLDIKENWNPREDGNWNTANSFTVTFLTSCTMQ